MARHHRLKFGSDSWPRAPFRPPNLVRTFRFAQDLRLSSETALRLPGSRANQATAAGKISWKRFGVFARRVHMPSTDAALSTGSQETSGRHKSFAVHSHSLASCSHEYPGISAHLPE